MNLLLALAITASVSAVVITVHTVRIMIRTELNRIETEERLLATAWRIRDRNLIAACERRLAEQRQILKSLRRIGLDWIKPINRPGAPSDQTPTPPQT